jgi:hypothetical protein
MIRSGVACMHFASNTLTALLLLPLPLLLSSLQKTCFRKLMPEFDNQGFGEV